jgi:UDP-N-acetyl-2-amino-2-deoxyglucuronate dehydrogenase
MTALKTGIVGAGKVAPTHAAALQALPESQLAGICSQSFDSAQRLAAQYDVPAYHTVEDMIVKGGVQAVLITTPHPAHAAPALEAMALGAHVMVEKPLASSLEDCDAMLAAAKKQNAKLAMISQRRLYAPSQRIKRAIETGKLGRLILGTVTMFGWRSQEYYESDAWRGTWAGEGGGVLVNQAPHQLDLLQWFMGDIDELYGCWSNLNHPYIEVEDTALAVIRFRNGALGNILVSNSQNPALYCRVSVHGSNGASMSVQTDGDAMFIAGMSTVTEPPINDVWTVPEEAGMLAQWQREDQNFFQTVDTTRYYHQLQIQDFLQSILEDRAPMVTGEEGRKTVEIFTAIYRSQRERRPIKFPLMPEAVSNSNQ